MQNIPKKIMEVKPQIVAMGGGGFSQELENPLLDDFVLGLTGKKCPRVCFVPTASGDAQEYIDKFYDHFPNNRAEASHLSLFRRSDVTDFKSFLLKQDLIYVGGGSTANMLAIWRIHGIDRILREAWETGVVLTGLSAGMICWFEESLTDSFRGIPMPLKDGLSFLNGSACPHYDSEMERRPAYHRFISTGELAGGFAADDGVALHFLEDKLMEAISSRPDANAYHVVLKNGQIVESVIKPRYLGKRETKQL